MATFPIVTPDAAALSQGPFMKQLSEPMKAQFPISTAQGPSGFNDPVASVTYLANRFFGGAAESKARNFARDEMAHAGKMERLNATFQSIMQDPNVTNEVKQQVASDYHETVGQMGLQTLKDSKADKKNPLVNMLSQAFEGMTGGQMPKRGGKDIDPMTKVGEWWSMAKSDAGSRSVQTQATLAKMQQTAKEAHGRGMSRQQIGSLLTPDIQKLSILTSPENAKLMTENVIAGILTPQEQIQQTMDQRILEGLGLTGTPLGAPANIQVVQPTVAPIEGQSGSPDAPAGPPPRANAGPPPLSGPSPMILPQRYPPMAQPNVIPEGMPVEDVEELARADVAAGRQPRVARDPESLGYDPTQPLSGQGGPSEVWKMGQTPAMNARLKLAGMGVQYRSYIVPGVTGPIMAAKDPMTGKVYTKDAQLLPDTSVPIDAVPPGMAVPGQWYGEVGGQPVMGGRDAFGRNYPSMIQTNQGPMPIAPIPYGGGRGGMNPAQEQLYEARMQVFMIDSAVSQLAGYTGGMSPRQVIDTVNQLEQTIRDPENRKRWGASKAEIVQGLLFMDPNAQEKAKANLEIYLERTGQSVDFTAPGLSMQVDRLGRVTAVPGGQQRRTTVAPPPDDRTADEILSHFEQ